MKKLLYLMVSGAFLVTACSKEMIEPQGSTAEAPQKNFAVSGQGETQIKDFLTVYENWKTNPNTTFNNMTKENAIWLMEASINYKNAFKLSYWEDRKTTETNYTPTLVEGNTESFTGSSILSTFALMDAAITNQKANNTHDMILVVDLYLDEENNSQIVMQGTSANSLPISNVSDPIGIGADDYWFPGMLQGKCATFSGDYSGVMDAAERVEDIVNHNWWFNYYRNTYNPQDVIYYTNVQTTNIPPNYNSDPNGLWGGGSVNTCQSPSDMNGIFTQDEAVAFRGIPSGSQLISTDYLGGMAYGPGSPVFHSMNQKYGIPHI